MVSATGSALISGFLCAEEFKLAHHPATRAAQHTEPRGGVGRWHLILVPRDAHSIRSLPPAGSA
jgi:hypothetical protein